MDPQKNNSYCAVTINMLQMIKVLQVAQGFVNTIFLVLIFKEAEVEEPWQHGALRTIMIIPDLGGRVIMLIQAYEFLVMLVIIKKQQNLSLGEIMYEVNNEQSYKSFLLKERIMKYVFGCCTTSLVVFSLITTFKFYSSEVTPSELTFLFIIEVLFPYVFLCTTLAVLLWYMRKYHSFERK